ncbi:MAG TPA: signal peptidase I [Candidatus Nanoarchaeia archaeon]|nr:signal peptidase I [Candidatus Nanoarchaeia archaeon]
MNWRKIWDFIWNDNSLLSWIVNVILAFIIVKFLLYPGLGLVLQTNHPIVAVVSGSMDHNGNFDSWWKAQGNWYEEHGFTKQQVKSWKMSNGFNKGDIIVLRGSKTLNPGDIIVFQGNSDNPIIHRIINVEKEKLFYTTKGDANPDSSEYLGEVNIPKERIIGRAVFKIPYLGWIKILFAQLLGF